jgi:carboxyl-terminal processing protease
MSRSVKFAVIALSLVVFLYVGMGYVLGKTSDDRSYRGLALFGEVLQRVQQDYVEEPNLPLVTSGALHGLVEALDPQSSYLSPNEYAEYKKALQSGQRGEIGVVLSKRFGYVAIVSVVPDSPARRAGLRSGDVLESITGYSTREMSVAQAQVLLNGEPGTAVKVSVISRRLGSGTQAEELEVVRREVAFPAIEADRLEGDVGYLRVVALNAGKSGEIRQKLQQFERQGVRKVVLDLRDCAAGDMNEAFETARLFVPAGTLGSLKGQTMAAKQFAADAEKVVWKQPFAVLISNGTAGPGEILAAALGGNAAAFGAKPELVGERTFGTASEQKLIPLEDGAALFLTVANYYSPAGKVILEEGVLPTTEVRVAADATDEETTPEGSADDAVLKKAIEILQGSATPDKKGQAQLRQRTRKSDRAA